MNYFRDCLNVQDVKFLFRQLVSDKNLSGIANTYGVQDVTNYRKTGANIVKVRPAYMAK